jgi:hypothetical protein
MDISDSMDNTTLESLVYQQATYQFYLALFAILACLICIWLVFIFGRRLQLSASTRSILVQSLAKQEFEALYRDLVAEATRGPLDPKDQPPSEFGPLAQLYDDNFKSYKDRFSEPPISFSKDDKETDEERTTRLNTLEECEEWEKRERLRFAERKNNLEIQAKENAERNVPQSMDISLLGGGFSFLLEFSAVIVIIFTLMTLGILEVLDGKDITTILASIAGYVLGKAGSRSESKEEKPIEKPIEMKTKGN